jgi:hypothetical protein
VHATPVIDLLALDYQIFIEKGTTPVPSLKKGGELGPSAASSYDIPDPILSAAGTARFSLMSVVRVRFPSFLQGGDRGGSL